MNYRATCPFIRLYLSHNLTLITTFIFALPQGLIYKVKAALNLEILFIIFLKFKNSKYRVLLYIGY